MKSNIQPGHVVDTLDIARDNEASNSDPRTIVMAVQEVSKISCGPSAGIADGSYFKLRAKKRASILVVLNGPSDGSTSKFIFSDANSGTIVNFTSGTNWQPGADTAAEVTSLADAIEPALAVAGWSVEAFPDSSAFRLTYRNFDINLPAASDSANTGYISDAAVDAIGGAHRFYCYFQNDIITTDPNAGGSLDDPGYPNAIPVGITLGNDDSPSVVAQKIADGFNSNTLEFTATVSGSVVSLTHVEPGEIENISDGGTGWTMYVETQGA